MKSCRVTFAGQLSRVEDAFSWMGFGCFFFFDKLDGIWVVGIIVRKTLAFEVDETKQGVM